MQWRFRLLCLLWAGFPALAAVSYKYDVKPILDKNCTECHDSLGHDPDLSSFPFQSDKFSNQGSVVEKILEKTNAKTMPPGNRPKLNSQQINLIRRWRDEGMAS